MGFNDYFLIVFLVFLGFFFSFPKCSYPHEFHNPRSRRVLAPEKSENDGEEEEEEEEKEEEDDEFI